MMVKIWFDLQKNDDVNYYFTTTTKKDYYALC